MNSFALLNIDTDSNSESESYPNSEKLNIDDHFQVLAIDASRSDLNPRLSGNNMELNFEYLLIDEFIRNSRSGIILDVCEENRPLWVDLIYPVELEEDGIRNNIEWKYMFDDIISRIPDQFPLFQVDIITRRSCFREIMNFITNSSNKSTKITVSVFKNSNILLFSHERDSSNDPNVFGFAFENMFTQRKHQALSLDACNNNSITPLQPCEEEHYRLYNYRIGNLNTLVYCETDATIFEETSNTYQSVELKCISHRTRTKHFRSIPNQLAHQRNFPEDYFWQMFFSGTRYCYVGVHHRVDNGTHTSLKSVDKFDISKHPGWWMQTQQKHEHCGVVDGQSKMCGSVFNGKNVHKNKCIDKGTERKSDDGARSNDCSTTGYYGKYNKFCHLLTTITNQVRAVASTNTSEDHLDITIHINPRYIKAVVNSSQESAENILFRENSSSVERLVEYLK